MSAPHFTYTMADPQDRSATITVHAFCASFAYDYRTKTITARMEGYRSANAFLADDPTVDVATIAISLAPKPATIDPQTQFPTDDAIPGFAETLAAHPDLVAAIAGGVYSIAAAMTHRFPNAQVVS